MKTYLKILILVSFTSALFAQSSLNFNDYLNYLESNKDMVYSSLLSRFDAGKFKTNLNNNFDDALYADSISIKYSLTADEKDLINKNGFVVSQRLSQNSFSRQFVDIYEKDLPVYISSDAILHAIHKSYDHILKDIEDVILLPKLKTLMWQLHNNLSLFNNRYPPGAEFENRIKDIDAYLTVPLKLLDASAEPVYSTNKEFVDQMLVLIKAEEFSEINFFSEKPRKIDFSQFKPRGHYDDIYYPQLADYFRAMIWLGKTELYLIQDNSYDAAEFRDVQRQSVMAVLIKELVDFSDSRNIISSIDNTIRLFVGDQDNVTLENIDEVLVLAGIESSAELLDSLAFVGFQNTLKQQPYADQKILSQVLIVDPMNPDELKPASAFMIFGQRFIVDSYVTGSVVYDKIKFNNEKILRMLPSTLDILFALGNNAALQLLKDEIDNYKYSSNLNALRYVIDNYTDDFWNSSIYNNWLNCIRKLNPPDDRTNLPNFMQTASWWQQKMNGQLGSWTELRHDNLLYAKQSYTGGASCEYPFSYVEPVPEFYLSVKQLASSAIEKINTLLPDAMRNRVINYYNNLYSAADTLYSISQKELSNQPLSANENVFLKNMIVKGGMCGVIYEGWYAKLFYNEFDATVNESNYIVADYHTAPTDAAGNYVGWVKHAGTGPVDLMVFNTMLPSGENVAFVGPVYSYHEYTTTNFLRLSDSDWNAEYMKIAQRPDWTNIYLTDVSGNEQAAGPSLLTGIKNEPNNNLPDEYILASNYPNPFNPSTIISFKIPSNCSGKLVQLKIYNITGELISILVNKELPAGNYLSKWNGTNSVNSQVSSGIYFYTISAGDLNYTGKMNLIR